MSEPYTFTWHPVENVLEVALTGLWKIEDIEPYYAALQTFAMAHITGPCQVLTDLSHYPTQRPEVADAHAAKLAQVQENSPVQREAWVVTGVVAKMQASRGAESGETPVNMFNDRESAWAYLRTPLAA